MPEDKRKIVQSSAKSPSIKRVQENDRRSVTDTRRSVCAQNWRSKKKKQEEKKKKKRPEKARRARKSRTVVICQQRPALWEGGRRRWRRRRRQGRPDSVEGSEVLVPLPQHPTLPRRGLGRHLSRAVRVPDCGAQRSQRVGLAIPTCTSDGSGGRKQQRKPQTQKRGRGREWGERS